MVIVIVVFAERGLSVWFTLLVISLSGMSLSGVEALLSPVMNKPAITTTRVKRISNLFIINYVIAPSTTKP